MAAAGYECMAEGEPHAANWVLSSLDPYAMFLACNQDFPLMIIPVLAANLETDADRLYDAIRKHLEAEARRAAKAAKAASDQGGGPGPEDKCEECGLLFGEVSPDCPHQIWDRHPKPAPAEVTQ